MNIGGAMQGLACLLSWHYTTVYHDSAWHGDLLITTDALLINNVPACWWHDSSLIDMSAAVHKFHRGYLGKWHNGRQMKAKWQAAHFIPCILLLDIYQ